VAAIQVAIDNMNNGAKCRDALDVIREFREKIGQPASP
jgi:hypothetical protein